MLSFYRLCFHACLAATLSSGLLIADESQAVKEPESAVKTEPDIKKLSEAFGHFIGRNLRSSGLNFDMDNFTRGIREGESGKPAPMTDREYELQMIALQEKAFKKLSEENLTAAEKFLRDNRNERGLIELIPGKLQYIVIKPGTGPIVSEHANPKIHYTGKYLDGTVFGSSEDGDGPITVPLDQTIPGFSKGLLGMKEGEKRRLFVHPDMGYGKSGHLPPNSMLIFEVEVLEADSSDPSSLDLDDELSDDYENRPANGRDNDDDDDEDDDSDDNDDSDEIYKNPSSKR